MCGRYTLTSTSEVMEEFGLSELPPDLAPRYNIAPTQPAPVIVNASGEERRLELFRWGLIPRWAKDPSIGNRLINARGESVGGKPAFRSAYARRRCLVVADGFYEWKRENKSKVPYFIHCESGRPMGFAGLWERWKAPDGDWVRSFTIVTTDANDVVAPIHGRMPVIVAPEDYERWLTADELPPDALADIVTTPPSSGLEAYEVSKVVNSPQNDVPECVKHAPSQPSLF